MPDSPSDATSPALRNAGLAILALLVIAAVFYHTPALAANRVASELFAWLLAGGMLVAYVRGDIALQSCADLNGKAPVVRGFAAMFGLLSLLIPPFHSVDVSCYINRGWQQVHYGLNPYVHRVLDIPNWQLDPMFRPHWAEARSPYGFLFEELAWLICRLGGGHWTTTLLGFKVASLAVYTLTGWIVWLGCRRMGLPRPERQLYLVLWNPLIIVHSLINAHNDLWMGMLTAVAVYMAVTGTWLWTIPALVAAALIKYASAALLPFTVLFVGRHSGWRKTCAGMCLCISVIALSAWPYLHNDWRSFFTGQGTANTVVQNSLAGMALFPFEMAVRQRPSLQDSWEDVAKGITLTFGVAFLLFYASLFWKRLRGGPYNREVYLYDCVLVPFVLVCLASSKYYAWYLGMFFPMALWLPEGDRLRRVVLVVTCANLLSVTFVAQAHFLNTLLMLVIPVIAVLRVEPVDQSAALA